MANVTRLGMHVPYGLFGRGGACLRIVERPSVREDGTTVLAIMLEDPKAASGERTVLAEFQLDHDAILGIMALARASYLHGERLP